MLLVRELQLGRKYMRHTGPHALPTVLSRIRGLQSLVAHRIEVAPEILPTLCNNSASLMELDLQHLAAANHVIPSFPALRTLRIGCCDRSKYNTNRSASDFPKLESIHVRGRGSGRLLHYLAQCRSVGLSPCTCIDQDGRCLACQV